MTEMGKSIGWAFLLLGSAFGALAACSSDDAAAPAVAAPQDGGAVAVTQPGDAGGSEFVADGSAPDVCLTRNAAYCPADWECGSFDDGCGTGTVYCGSSTPTGCSPTGFSQCGAVVPNKCYTCAPATGACPAGESAYACPTSSLPLGCHVVGADAETDAGGHTCCPTKG